MAKRLVIGVDWVGPFSRSDVCGLAKEWSDGLYLVYGKLRGKGRQLWRAQYVGLSKTTLCQRASSSQHHKLKQLHDDRIYWLGSIATSEPSGKRAHVTRKTLKYAEWAHVYAMKTPLNTRLNNMPPAAVTVLNRWWKPSGEPWLRRRDKNWPDLIEIGEDFRARSVFFRSPHVRYLGG